MAIKKIKTLADWRKIYNTKIFDAAMQTLCLKLPLANFDKEEEERVKGFFCYYDFRRLEANFQEAEKDSHFRPIHDPYGWIQETQRYYVNFNVVCFYLSMEIGNFNPKLDWIFRGYLYELTGQHKNPSIFTADHIELLIMEHYDKDRRKFERL
jgi:hypothetical protein